MNPSPRIWYPWKERNSNYSVMTAFTLVAEVAEQIISGVAHLTKEKLRDLQNSPTTTGVITQRGFEICSCGIEICNTVSAAPEV